MAGVLVIGASGYVGGAVAQAARSSGYTVYAQTRNNAKSASLKANELVPVVCDPKDAVALHPVVEQCEFVIDCTSDYADPSAIPDACLAAIRSCNSRSFTKKHYIYTSGGLVHGDHAEHVHEDVVTEQLAWRVDLERRLVGLSDVDCTVLRPSFVYGKSGGFFAHVLFTAPAGETLQIAGNPHKRWSWVHVDDLAEAYVRIMQRRSVAAGRVYDIGEPFGPTYRELRVAGAQLAGFESEVETIAATEGFDAMVDVNFLVDAKRARDELGWVPRHTGIMSQMPLYYEAYKAAKQQHQDTA